jgi:branched-chain amino acid transport system substrate-binding protein
MAGPFIGRRGALTIAAGALAAPAVLRHARAASRTIKLGFVSPRTGPIAAFGEADPFVLGGVKKILDEGVTIAGTHYPVVVIERDSQSSAARASEVAADLITKDKVDILLASSTADTTNPVSDQAEVNGVPCISTDTPWEAWFFGRKGDPAKPFQYTYHFFWGIQNISAAFVAMWNSVDTNKKIGCLWANDPDGVALSDKIHGLPPIYQKAGFTLVDTGMFPSGSNDFSAQIAQFKQQGVDLLTGVFVPPDFATFWTQAAQQGFKPKVATIAKALLFPSSVDALGPRGNGLSSEVWWGPNHPFSSSLTGQTSKQFCDAYTAATKKQWTQPIGFKHALIEVAMNVLKRTKDINNPDSIMAAVKDTDMNTLVGPVTWKPGPTVPIPNICTTPLVGGQWTPGKPFPYELLVANNSTAPIIPMEKKFAPISYG